MNLKSLSRNILIPATLAPLAANVSAIALEEIIVTAQKRSENVQDVPIAISAFSANELSKAGVQSYNDIGMVTPGLETNRQIGAATPFIRGIGAQSGTVGVESATTMFVDDIYVSSTVDASLNFNNIERVEVLKGPQGTLFGRNTTGGVIHIITKEPSGEPELNIGVFAGDYDTYGSTLYAANGLTDTISADLAVSVQRMNDFYGTNVANGDGVGFEEHTSFRSKVIWEPTDRTKVRFIAGWTERDEDVGITRQCDRDASAFGCTGGQFATPNFHDTNSDMTPYIHNVTKSYSVKLNQEFDLFDFVSITSYNDNDNFQLLDQDSVALPIVTAPLWQSNETWSQEFQILSNAEDKPYRWIVGLYYWDDESRYDPLNLYGLGIPGGVEIEIFSGVETQSVAVFGQMTYDITEATALTLGIRYTEDDRENTGFTRFTLPGGAANEAHFSDSTTWSEPTWRVALDHQITDEVMGYLTYNRGFKSGTYNTVNSGGAGFPPVDPEILDAYEAGFKADFLDGRLRLNAGAFYYEYENIQLQKIDGGIAFLLNAAEAEIKGFEVEGQASLTDNLNIRFGLSYLDSEYTKFQGCPINIPTADAFGGALGPIGAGNLKAVGDCSGNELVRAPDYTFNVGFTYFVPTDAGIWGASATAAYNDGFFWEPGNRNFEDSVTMVNGELSWEDDSGKYKVRIYGKNLLDEEYSIYTTEAQFGDTEAPAAPRTWGVGFDMAVF
jgi:iron complex outermembrane recepter protein